MWAKLLQNLLYFSYTLLECTGTAAAALSKIPDISTAPFLHPTPYSDMVMNLLGSHYAVALVAVVVIVVDADAYFPPAAAATGDDDETKLFFQEV